MSFEDKEKAAPQAHHLERESFLQNEWERYPAFPVDFQYGGRLIHIQPLPGSQEKSPVQSLTVEIMKAPQIFRGQSHQRVFQLSSDVNSLVSSAIGVPISILREGDWIAIQCHAPGVEGDQDGEYRVSQLRLLAPRRERSLQISSNEEIQKNWNLYLSELRSFFSQQHFVEIATPSLVPSPGTEPFLDVYQWGHLYLPTSPELHLKKALSAGYSRIFEIRSCFRRGEISNRHQPEFTMLEWYRSFANLDEIKQDVKSLLISLRHFFDTALQKNVSNIDEFKEYSFQELFRQILEFQLEPDTSIEELKKLAARLGMHSSVQNYQIWDDVFYQIFVEKIEPVIEKESFRHPIFLTKYPPSQAALARLTSDGWGDRWELYWQGMELANAFHELNDPQIQRQRFEEDLRLKVASGRDPVALDQDFLRALESGLPPSAGIALGVERLFLCFNLGLTIRDLRLFPYVQ